MNPGDYADCLNGVLVPEIGVLDSAGLRSGDNYGENPLSVQPRLNERDPHPPPCGMTRKQAQALLDKLRNTKPRNWRERRQKARVIAQAYRRRKPELVFDQPSDSPF